MNEALNLVRPYGDRGEPMPWSKKGRKNAMFFLEDDHCLTKVLSKVKQTLLDWSRVRAGAIPPKYFN